MKTELQSGSWKPSNWSIRTWLLLLFFAFILLTPVAIRSICLQQIPDIELPFDVEQFAGADVPREEDALTYYASAAEKLKTISSEWLVTALGDAASVEKQWDERLDQWLIDNSNILADLELASKCEQVTKRRFNQGEIELSLIVEFRNLMRVSEAEARRCERSENLDAAWEWHRRTLRLAHHSEKLGLLFDHLLGWAIRNSALESIERWASHRSLTAEQLRRARTELNQSMSNREKLSEIMIAEYLYSQTVLESDAGPDYLLPELGNLDSIGLLSANMKRFYLWSIGQPEVALRFSRQILVNNITQIDRPPHLRCLNTRLPYPAVYELDRTHKKRPEQLTPIQLGKALESSLGKNLIKTGIFFHLGENDNEAPDTDQKYRLQDVLVAMMNVVLASHEHYRSNGEFPETLEQLVPLYLESVPIDSMNETRKPLIYRRDSPGTAITWTVGFNGVDDGGKIESSEPFPPDRGYRIFITDKPESQQEKATSAINEDAP